MGVWTLVMTKIWLFVGRMYQRIWQEKKILALYLFIVFFELLQSVEKNVRWKIHAQKYFSVPKSLDFPAFFRHVFNMSNAGVDVIEFWESWLQTFPTKFGK